MIRWRTILPTITMAGRLLAVASLCVAGCSTEDPRFKSLREQYLLAAEPTEPTTIADATTGVAEDSRVEFVGRVAANEFEAFTPGQASFLVTEILSDDHGHGSDHDADNCPFCKRRAANAPRAAVQLVDAAGATIEVDARELLGIQPGDTVVVQGTGELNAKLEMLFVDADGIYVRTSGGNE